MAMSDDNEATGSTIENRMYSGDLRTCSVCGTKRPAKYLRDGVCDDDWHGRLAAIENTAAPDQVVQAACVDCAGTGVLNGLHCHHCNGTGKRQLITETVLVTVGAAEPK